MRPERLITNLDIFQQSVTGISAVVTSSFSFLILKFTRKVTGQQKSQSLERGVLEQEPYFRVSTEAVEEHIRVFALAADLPNALGAANRFPLPAHLVYKMIPT